MQTCTRPLDHSQRTCCWEKTTATVTEHAADSFLVKHRGKSEVPNRLNPGSGFLRVDRWRLSVTLSDFCCWEMLCLFLFSLQCSKTNSSKWLQGKVVLERRTLCWSGRWNSLHLSFWLLWISVSTPRYASDSLAWRTLAAKIISARKRRFEMNFSIAFRLCFPSKCFEGFHDRVYF